MDRWETFILPRQLALSAPLLRCSPLLVVCRTKNWHVVGLECAGGRQRRCVIKFSLRSQRLAPNDRRTDGRRRNDVSYTLRCTRQVNSRNKWLHRNTAVVLLLEKCAMPQQYTAQWSFKVIRGRRFRYQSKAHMRPFISE